MGVFDWLFGGGKPKNAQKAEDEPSATSDLDSRFLRIRDKNFFGQFAKSPNGRYTVAWRDGHFVGTANGGSKKVSGRVLLLDGDKVVVDRKMPRPNDGKIADTGIFIIHDWVDFETLSGVFHAINVQGETVVKKRFAANMLNNGLSDDGGLAVCQTANAPNRDGNILTVFDLTKGTEIARWQPESGWADNYQFPGGDVLRLVDRDGGACEYTLHGELVNRDQWVESRLAKGDLHLIEVMLKDADGHPEGDLLRKLLEGTEAALDGPDAHPQTRALALKLRGLCFEGSGALAEALESYDKALALNPKIGVKQRADRIRKVLTGPIRPR